MLNRIARFDREIKMLRVTLMLAVVICTSPSLSIAADPPKTEQAAAKSPTQAELDKRFQETLTDATLSGHFTDQSKPGAALPKEEKYTIKSVTKAKDDIWVFQARIQYGGHDVTLPLPLRVVWAGDTPVITLDNFPVPGFGKFTCRVMIYDDKYAGTWDGGDHGGLLFGKITREKANESDAK
jgi:hypothetical protein